MGGNIETPIEIIKRRYSKGEITREEFEEMKKRICMIIYRIRTPIKF